LSEAKRVLASRASARSSRIEARRFADSTANAAIVALKLVIRSLSWLLVAVEPRRGARCRDQPREVLARLGAEERLETCAGRALGRDVVVGVVERLRDRSGRAPTGRRRGSRPPSAC
jgi:hypothetical protein